jgi:hypothetical protein
MITRQRNYITLPPIVTTPIDDRISVIVPVARTNLCQNPSFETNTTSWTAIGGSIARSTLFQYHGAYSLAITPTAATTDGARYDTVSLVSGTTYAYSCKVLGIAGKSYKLSLETTAGVELHSKTFVATGRWQWVYGYYLETSTTTRRLTVRKAGGTETSIFYIDGAQVEAVLAGESVSTYIDGAQLGLVPNQSPVAYYWTGTPHASSSVRSGLTRAGGMVIPFTSFGFFLTALIGLGLAPPQNVATEYAQIDGGYDDYTRKPTRQFTIQGNFESAGDYLRLRQQRGGLSRLLDRDLVAQDQRLVLLREVVDECDQVVSSTCRLLGKYQGGLDGNTDNQLASVAPITFTQYLGVVLADGEVGASLNVSLSVSNANAIVQRNASGVWSALGTGMSGGGAAVYVIARGLDGTIYAGGDFTDAGGSGADYIAAWNGSAWSTLGGATAINGLVRAMSIGPDGSLYAGGAFTNAGGVAAADGIARWNGSAWTALGTGVAAGGVVWALTFGPDGTLYAGGDFTLMGGVANTARIAKWNGSAWSALGTGAAAGEVMTIAVYGTTVYAGGDFTNMGGIAAADGIAQWNGSVWAGLGTGIPSDNISTLALAANKQLYLGGAFPSINGQSIAYLAQWNGSSYAGIGTLNSQVFTISIENNGIVHIGGAFTVVNGITFPDSFARLTGNILTTENVDLPGTALVLALLATTDGSLYVGFNTAGTATAAATTTITNPGTARSYPTITINGPSSGTARIWSIVNVTTGRAIYLNLTLSLGEVATLVFTPDNLSFTSTFQGNVANAIMLGSSTADFFLQPGANSVAFFSASSTVVATLYYRPAFVSLDDVL